MCGVSLLLITFNVIVVVGGEKRAADRSTYKTLRYYTDFRYKRNVIISPQRVTNFQQLILFFFEFPAIILDRWENVSEIKTMFFENEPV